MKQLLRRREISVKMVWFLIVQNQLTVRLFKKSKTLDVLAKEQIKSKHKWRVKISDIFIELKNDCANHVICAIRRKYFKQLFTILRGWVPLLLLWNIVKKRNKVLSISYEHFSNKISLIHFDNRVLFFNAWFSTKYLFKT